MLLRLCNKLPSCHVTPDEQMNRWRDGWLPTSQSLDNSREEKFRRMIFVTSHKAWWEDDCFDSQRQLELIR